MAQQRLFWRHTAEPVPKLSLSFRLERCPHLLKTVVEAGFKDRPRNGGKSGLRSEIDPEPTLIFGTPIPPKRLRLFRTEADARFGPVELNIPCIRFRWSHALCFNSYSYFGLDIYILLILSSSVIRT